MAEPSDKALYEKVKKEAIRRFNIWPSAYASGWLVKEYKARFAEKHGRLSSPYSSATARNLARWYKEDWRNVCEMDKGEYKPCGRKVADVKRYPYCRPLHTSATPKTVYELSRSEREEMCKKKRKSMKRRRTKGKSPTRVYLK